MGDQGPAIDDWNNRSAAPRREHRKACRDNDHQDLRENNQKISDCCRGPARDREIGCGPDDRDGE